MKAYMLSGIKWDKDGAVVDLPAELRVVAEDKESAVDVASDTIGFCIHSATVEED